jgi:hypothetical protein
MKASTVVGGSRNHPVSVSEANSAQSLDRRKVEMPEGKPWNYAVSDVIDRAIRREITWPECRRLVAEMNAKEQLELELRLLDQAGQVLPEH